ncbi:DNA-binding protein [Maridesulfovibrio ferrireducens]|uniref:baseplate complex protein n=1 Tax=Maridesulfovibrio ferrireducens TaxID=246191 RepID=UPI001A242CF0|nr:DNA-binding protein [Maridesulfovibrio ferrireducens]MBI9109918.1 DNA-binding protein [Maridesulfovibrio ferrireducens]
MNTFLRLGDYNVPGYGLKVSGGMEIYDEELSGETSGTDVVNKGIKAKNLNVSLNIKFKDQDKLRELIQVLETKDENGEMKIYTIANRTANMGGIRQVRCTSSVGWDEQETVRAWSVSFSLREHLSVPERVEQREKGVAAVIKSEDGINSTSDSSVQPATDLKSSWDKVIKKVDEVVS